MKFQKFIILALQITTFAFSLFSFNVVIASGCAPLALLTVIEFSQADHIVSYRVVDYEDVLEGYPSYMDVEILRQFQGQLESSEIRITGNDNGLSTRPFVSNFDKETEWLQPLQFIDGKYYLPSCTPAVFIEDELVHGFIRPCSENPESEFFCGTLTFDNFDKFSNQSMAIDEFDTAREFFSEGISQGLQLCSGPFSRCNQIRGSYDPATGMLELPAIDVLPTPDDPIPLPYGISATLQQQEGSSNTFKVIKIEK